MHELDAFTALQVQLALPTKQLGALYVSTIQPQPQICNFYGGHSSVDCQVGYTFSHARSEQANFFTNFQRFSNLYSNSTLKNHKKTRMREQ